MNGLSPTELQNTTSLAAPMALRSAVSSAACFTTCPIFATADMFIPEREEPIDTDEQTYSVCASAWGIESISSLSAVVASLSTMAL